MRWRAACLLALLASVPAAAEPPACDPLADLAGASGATATLAITGIVPGSGATAAELAIAVTVAPSAAAQVQTVAYDPAHGSATAALLLDAQGEATVFVRIAAPDGADAVRSCRLTVTPAADDGPSPPRLADAAIAYLVGTEQEVPILSSQWLIEDDDAPPHATLLYHLATAVPYGELRLAGAVVAVGAVWSQLDIDEGRLVYRRLSDAVVLRTAEIGCAIDDGTFLVPDQILRLELLPTPGIALGTAGAPWREGDAPVALCPEALAYAFTGTVQVRVQTTAGAAPGDRLTLAVGAGADELSRDADGVYVANGGDLVVHASGGGDGAPLALVSADFWTPFGGDTGLLTRVLRALRFANDGGDPGAATRVLAVSLADAGGTAQASATASVPVEPVDDPPVVAEQVLGALLGWPGWATLTARDPDSPTLTWSLVAGPDNAELTVSAAGGCTILPRFAGTAACTVQVSDGVNPPQQRVLALRVTSPDEARPQPLAEAPAVAWAGEPWSADIPWDAPVAVTADPAAPAGLAVAMLDGRTARLTWTPPAAAADGWVAFALAASASADGAAGRLPVLLRLRVRPSGVH